MSEHRHLMDFEDAAAQFFGRDARAAYEWQQRFSSYIASEAWQHKRMQKLLSLAGIAAQPYHRMDWLVQQASRHLYRCEKCGTAGKHDEVHVWHRHYRTLGNEPVDDLAVLCGFCHSALHKIAAATGMSVEVVTARLLAPSATTANARGKV